MVTSNSTKQKEEVADSKSPKANGQLILYVACALGAIFVSFADLSINDPVSTIVKIKEILCVHLQFHSNTVIYSFLLIILLSLGVCFVRQPKDRIEAFALGLSIFGFLTLTPHQQPIDPDVPPSIINDSTISQNIIYSEVEAFGTYQDRPTLQKKPIASEYFIIKIR